MLTSLSLLPHPVRALPVAPGGFCEVYGDAPACRGTPPACTQCHLGSPPALNAYGTDVQAALVPETARPLSDTQFLAGLAQALTAVEALDSDEDGSTNLDEIIAGTSPSNGLQFPSADAACTDASCGDPAFVLKRVYLDFCGQQPDIEVLEQVSSSASPDTAIHAALDTCLDSEFWLGKDGQLWELAHPKVRPLQAIKSGEDAGVVPLADYYDDYALYAYANSDDHDVRDVLLADYFVRRESSPTRYTQGTPAGTQRVVASRRAGLITTNWFLVLNVMFTALPRTAAAQAYRSFLGLDIAKLEGLYPIENEPFDYDAKNVDAPDCAVCHSTLDPLAYPFKNYHGLTGVQGTYDANRIENTFSFEGPNITAMPEAGAIFGEPVFDLFEWAEVAANSDAFASSTVLDFWMLLVGHPPSGAENDEFDALWKDLRGTHQYRVEKMLHDLIDTEAYRVP